MRLIWQIATVVMLVTAPQRASFAERLVDPAKVLVSITLPLQMCADPPQLLAEYGA